MSNPTAQPTPTPAPPLFHFPQPGGTGESLAGLPLAVVDVETTGFSPGADRIVEVAVVRVAPDGTVMEQFVSLVDPGRDVGPTWVHQITDEMVAGAPTFADIAGDVLELFDGAVVVAHNAGFDGGFSDSSWPLPVSPPQQCRLRAPCSWHGGHASTCPTSSWSPAARSSDSPTPVPTVRWVTRWSPPSWRHSCC